MHLGQFTDPIRRQTSSSKELPEGDRKDQPSTNLDLQESTGTFTATDNMLQETPFGRGKKMIGQIMGQPNPLAPVPAQRPRQRPSWRRTRASPIATMTSKVEPTGRHISQTTTVHHKCQVARHTLVPCLCAD
ncbi:hypothetical protein BHE74_00048121 [Ensete ventricosum]|nr:hypothetical protein GW17_00049849 [Ensete ventricosum]RWW45995.1 hypothetical protein BHE74_00048121 [Ensete ventricosum]RZS12112.1 hypothetical protein BHM03_00043505 [Ensete ventricosum]